VTGTVGNSGDIDDAHGTRNVCFKGRERKRGGVHDRNCGNVCSRATMPEVRGGG
jgi:hypothetical protein